MLQRSNSISKALHVSYDRTVTGVTSKGLVVSLDIEGREPLCFRMPDADIAGILSTMHERPVSEETIRSVDNPDLFFAILQRLARGMLVEWHCFEAGSPVMRVTARASDYRFRYDDPPLTGLKLSRFAYVRRDADAFVLESSAIPARITFNGPVPSLFQGELAPEQPAARFLWQAGFMVSADEEEEGKEKYWEFHDRLFHATSRGMDERVANGGDYRFQDEDPPVPAIKPAMTGDEITLPLPSAGSPAPHGTFADVVEKRTSVRDHGPQPLTLDRLGEFLYRTSRTIGVRQAEPQDLLQRPYPGAGSLHELECYVVNNRCEGLEPSIYHYRSEAHRLTALPGTGAAAGQMIEAAFRAMGRQGRPDVLIVITSRLPRLSWKYRGIAYRLTLLDAGVLMQSMYLTATDMGLACCANGLGLHNVFHGAVDLDPLEETAIAEFTLSGSAPE